MKKHLILTILSIIIGITLSAQENPKIKKEAFFTSSMGLEEAKKAWQRASTITKKVLDCTTKR